MYQKGTSRLVREYIGDWRVWSGELLAVLEACPMYLSKDGIGGIYFTEEKTQVPLCWISAFKAPSHHGIARLSIQERERDTASVGLTPFSRCLFPVIPIRSFQTDNQYAFPYLFWSQT